MQARLTQRESLTLVAFSVLYTVNIAISNLCMSSLGSGDLEANHFKALNLVTVPFHQVVRATTPIFTIAISMIVLHKRYSQKTYISVRGTLGSLVNELRSGQLIPVVAGVGFATFGDYSVRLLLIEMAHGLIIDYSLPLLDSA